MATAPKPRGRKALPPAEQVGADHVSTTPADEAQDINTLHEHEQQLVEQFGDGLPWHPDHYEAAIRSELRRGCEAFLRAGSYLIVARECAQHGEWEGMLERLGIGRDQAWRMMETARRVRALPNVARAQHLIEAAGSQSKLIALLSLPEEEFSELAETGATGDLELDDIATMTRDELRAAIRDARADLAAKDEVHGKLQQRLDKAETNNAKLKRQLAKATPDEVTEELRKHLEAEVLQLSVSIVSQDASTPSLRTRVAALVEHAEQAGQDHSVYLAGVFAQLERHLHQVREEFMIPRAVAGDPEVDARLALAGEV